MQTATHPRHASRGSSAANRNSEFLWTTTTHRVVQCKSPVASVEFAHFKTPENKLPMMRLAERMKLISFSSPGSDLDAEFSTAQSTSCPKRTSKCHLGIIALCTYDVLERKNSTESSRGSAKNRCERVLSHSESSPKGLKEDATGLGKCDSRFAWGRDDSC